MKRQKPLKESVIIKKVKRKGKRGKREVAP